MTVEFIIQTLMLLVQSKSAVFNIFFRSLSLSVISDIEFQSIYYLFILSTTRADKMADMKRWRSSNLIYSPINTTNTRLQFSSLQDWAVQAEKILKNWKKKKKNLKYLLETVGCKIYLTKTEKMYYPKYCENRKCKETQRIFWLKCCVKTHKDGDNGIKILGIMKIVFRTSENKGSLRWIVNTCLFPLDDIVLKSSHHFTFSE